MLAAITFHIGKHAEQVEQVVAQTQNNTSMLTSILGFFALPIIVILFLTIFSIACIVATERDAHGAAIFFAICGAVIYYPQVWEIISNWRLLLLIIAAYGLCGGGWSTFRWFKYCKKFIESKDVKSRVDDYKWVQGERVKATEEEFAANVEAYYRQELRPSKHKSLLISWIIYWPWSLVWNVLGDFFTGIYDALANIYNRIADSVIRKALGKR